MQRPYVLVPVTLALTAAAAAPIAVGASQRPAHAAKASVSVSAKEFKFALRPTSARHGSVTFTVKNAGTIDHDFKIAGRATPKIKRGKSATLTVNLKKGTYSYLCTVPGHAAAGMKGNFKVS
ncbi:MAG TPA: plastocyanin/azurin family copper-binding protein [Baekduia sp.]|nr:plastocyanin/azurin family copper-binding protein [Baekduia sp.]